MRYRFVSIAGFGHALPAQCVSSEALEERLAPLYDRFRLRTGRLELMSGIRERRFWDPGTPPSAAAIRAGADALEKSGVARERIGCLVHASVCRDFLEPATATVVHRGLELSDECVVYDLSNACLGVANGMLAVANMIELGQIEAGLIVAAEDGRPLVEETIRALLKDENTTKNDLKLAFASFTIGSGAVGVVLQRAAKEADERRLLGGAVHSATEHNVLCQGGSEGAGTGPLMSTDSEALLEAGIDLAEKTFEHFLRELDWSRERIDRVVTHQVGTRHRTLLFERLALDTTMDYPTLAELGNVGSVSLPLSFALAAEQGFIRRGHHVALLGIGSGLSSAMLGVLW